MKRPFWIEDGGNHTYVSDVVAGKPLSEAVWKITRCNDFKCVCHNRVRDNQRGEYIDQIVIEAYERGQDV